MERIFGIFGKAWVLCNIRSFDSWGGCRTLNFSSSISCLHVYMAWLRGLVLSVHGRVDVSAVRRGCKISWCATSPSGHAAIVIKFTYAPPWRSGHSSCSRVFPYTYTHHLVFRALVVMVWADYPYKLPSQIGIQFLDSVESSQNADRVPWEI